MKPRSLSTRIILLSGNWIIAALVASALLLTYFYRDHVEEHYDAHVDMHLEELIGASAIDANGTFSLAFLPSDPRYDESHSGWYWEVRQAGKTLAKSPSLGDKGLDIGTIQPSDQTAVYEIPGPIHHELRVHVLKIRQVSNYEPLVYLASAPRADYKDDVSNYSSHIVSSFVLLGFGLLVSVVMQVGIALKP